MKELILTNGNISFLDDEDYEWASKWTWRDFKGHVFRTHHLRREKGKQIRRAMYLHREIFIRRGIDIKGKEIDHINRVKFDNQKNNLRISTSSQNKMNTRLNKRNISGYRGVSWHKHNKKWWARINIKKKYLNLGFFDNKEEAAKAYDEAAVKYYGEFAYPNYLR